MCETQLFGCQNSEANRRSGGSIGKATGNVIISLNVPPALQIHNSGKKIFSLSASS
jgi:hypothetical protein